MATLEGKTIVIVGGTSGIGFGVAKAALLSQAARVIVASSSEARVGNALTRLREVIGGQNLPGQVDGRVVDAKDMRSVQTFIEGVREIDHLVWTSGDQGVGIGPGLQDVDLETRKGRVKFPSFEKRALM